MTAHVTPAQPFARVIPSALRRLRPLGLARQEIPAEFAGRTGRVRLKAARWRVGPPANQFGELRAVRIVGPTCDITNLMLFPTDPARLPVFVTELLAFGGRPHLLFLDLQTPGLTAAQVPQIAWAAANASAAAPDLPRVANAPAWAARHSTGHYMMTRTTDPAHTPALLSACGAYLGAWADLADAVAGPCETSGHAAIAEYKRDHLAHYPGRPFLDRTFGAGWADAFLTGFLYR